MRQALKQAWPERGSGGLRPAGSGGLRPAVSGGLRPAVSGGLRPAIVGGVAAPKPRATTIVWRQRAPRASFRHRVAEWRARNWRRVVLMWFVLSLIIMAVAAEPKSDFPKAQARSLPAVQTILRVAGGLTVAGVPVLLVALP